MSARLKAPGGPPVAWLYGLAVVAALFSGIGQMPILKRYYITDLPLMGWSENFYTLSDIHYYSAAIMLFLLFWRLAISIRFRPSWSWGPRTLWGALLLALLIFTGALKAAVNSGFFIEPTTFMYIDFIHLGSAIIFMFTGLAGLFRSRARTA